MPASELGAVVGPYGHGKGTCETCGATRHEKCQSCRHGWRHSTGAHVGPCTEDLIEKPKKEHNAATV